MLTYPNVFPQGNYKEDTLYPTLAYIKAYVKVRTNVHSLRVS